MKVGGHGGVANDFDESDQNASNSKFSPDNIDAGFDKNGNFFMDLNVTGDGGIGFPFDVGGLTDFILDEYGDFFGPLVNDPGFTVGLQLVIGDAFANEFHGVGRSGQTGNRTDETIKIGGKEYRFGFF